MSRSEQLTRHLKSLTTTTPDVEAAAVVDNDGLMIASSLPADVEDERVAAMSPAPRPIGRRKACAARSATRTDMKGEGRDV